MKNIDKALLSPELDAVAAQKIARAEAESAALKQAAVTALPGPTRDIFAPAPEIVVGRWKVRPFYDLDFTTLELLQHPVSEMMKKALASGASPTEEFIPSGREAWLLFWIMTHPPDDSVRLFIPAEREGIEAEARQEFGLLSLAALIKLYQAVVKQIEICTSAEVEYTSTEPNAEGATAEAAVPKS